MTCVPLGLAPSFGFGDRIGLATAGHVESMNRAGSGIEPIYPQQSIREMTRTQRNAQQVMDDALNGAKDAGWKGKIGADADHLKTPADVDVLVMGTNSIMSLIESFSLLVAFFIDNNVYD